MKTYIREYDLIVGATYKGVGRNFDRGVWTGTAIRGLRHKFGEQFLDDELHWDADDHYGTFKPFEIVMYPDTLIGALYRLRDAVRAFNAAMRAAFKAVIEKRFPW